MIDVISTTTVARPLAVPKTRVDPVADGDSRWVRLVFSYVAWATAWLLFGTLVGEYRASNSSCRISMTSRG